MQLKVDNTKRSFFNSSFHLQTNTKTSGARDFVIFASELWNQLPNDIRSSAKLKTFKPKLKTYFFLNIAFES